MNALLVYYSFTGQAQRAVEIAAQRCRDAGFETSLCRIDFADPSLRLKRPMSPAQVKRWTAAAAAGETFALSVEPAAALQGAYDFVGLFSNTWQDHPAPPIRSLLALPQMQAVLAGTPFAVYVICRWLWKNNAQIVQREAEAAGGVCLGVEHFGHRGGAVSSLIRTVSYLMSSGGAVARIGGLRLPLPEYGLSDASIARVGSYTREMTAAARAARASAAA